MQNINSRNILADIFSFYTQGGQEYRSLSKEFEQLRYCHKTRALYSSTKQ